MNLATILAAIQAGITAIPEGLALINEVKALFSTNDQATIEAAVAEADAAADRQHEEGQNL
jgi:large exoprotein involved in heme utilization and adhesion